MRRRIDIDGLCKSALRQLRLATDQGRGPLPLPQTCLLSLDDLLSKEPEALEEALSAPAGG